MAWAPWTQHWPRGHSLRDLSSSDSSTRPQGLPVSMGQGLSGLDQLLGSSRQGLLQGLLTPDLTRLSVPESVLNKARCCPRLAVGRRITSSVAPPRIAPRSLGEGGSESSLAAGQSSSAAPRGLERARSPEMRAAPGTARPGPCVLTAQSDTRSVCATAGGSCALPGPRCGLRLPPLCAPAAGPGAGPRGGACGRGLGAP